MWTRLARVFREFRPDITHTHSYLLRYAFPVRQGTMVHTVHNVAGEEPGRVVNRLAFRRGVLPVAVSQRVADSFLKTYGFTPAATIPNGIDIPCFHKPEARGEWRRSQGFADADVLILSVARLEPQKAPLDLIQAFARGCAQAHLLMAGDGSLLEAARMCAGHCGVAGRVRFLGVRSDVPEMLASADIFALASRWEGSPLALMEAMAARLPVVATSVGGVPELVEDGVTGILVPAGDTDALGQALARLAHDPERRRAMGVAAGVRATRFSVDAMVASYSELFERCR
jgi:glycosyltransferase involved in cell wall biosynthesis